MHEFESAWWKVALPETWTASVQESCVEILRVSGAGALHISCVKKENGPVTTSDLTDWAEKPGDPEEPWLPKTFGILSGLGRERVTGSLCRFEWYLCREEFMFFATYFCPLGRESEEIQEVTSILSSIELNSGGAQHVH